MNESTASVGEVVGKSAVEIRSALKGLRRDVLERLFVLILTVEPTLSPRQVAKLRGKHPKTIVRLIQAKKLRAFQWAGKDYEIPISAVRERDENTATLPTKPSSAEIDELKKLLRSLVSG